jgi:hypothetical protein
MVLKRLGNTVCASSMNKKAKLRAIAELQGAPYPNALLNIYGLPRKLIIFDINKVLLFRQAKSSKYTLRPHAREFIESMSERFTLAVWTSMTKRFAVQILADIFPNEETPLLFHWYQNRCRTIEAENKVDKPLFLKELSKVWGEHSRYNDSNTVSYVLPVEAAPHALMYELGCCRFPADTD